MKYSIGIIIVLFLSKLSQGQNVNPADLHMDSLSHDTLTIETAIATALQNNYDIQIARNDSIIAAINYSYRNAAFLPTVNAGTTLLTNASSQNATFQSGDVSKSIHTNNTNANLSGTWVLFNGFRMFVNRSRMKELLDLGSLTAKNQVINTIADVITTYYDIVRQEQQLRNVREQMQLSLDQLKLAQYKFDIGTGIKPDVLQAQIDYNQFRASEINQIAVIEQRKQALDILMNVSQSINYEVTDAIPINMDLTLGDLLNDLIQQSPTLQIGRKNIDVAQTEVKLAKTGYFPTISLTGAYNFSRTNNSVVLNPNSPLANTNHGFNYGLTASIPIFNQFSVKQQVKLAEANVDFQKLIYDKQRLTITDSVINAYRSYDAQKKIVALGDSSIAWARENLNIARERYRVGITNFIELRTAEQNLEQTQTTQITARYSLKLAETQLLRLRGELLRRQ